jgi:hypothetical protein
MKGRVVVGVIAVLLAACGSSVANPAANSGGQTTSAGAGSGGGVGAAPCGPGHAKTLAMSSQARVYVSARNVYGCARGGHPYQLGQTTSCLDGPLVGTVAVRGVLAAYGSERCGVDTGTSTVIVQRLSDGKMLAQQPATTAFGVESHVMVTAIVLAGDGSVAWISVLDSIVASRHATQVRAFDRHGARLLDHGNSIDTSHLRLLGSKVSWKHGSSWRSARLA